MRNLRRHMVSKHGMSKEEVDRRTNKRHQMPRGPCNYWAHMPPGQTVTVLSDDALTTDAVRFSSAAATPSRSGPF